MKRLLVTLVVVALFAVGLSACKGTGISEGSFRWGDVKENVGDCRYLNRLLKIETQVSQSDFVLKDEDVSPEEFDFEVTVTAEQICTHQGEECVPASDPADGEWRELAPVEIDQVDVLREHPWSSDVRPIGVEQTLRAKERSSRDAHCSTKHEAEYGQAGSISAHDLVFLDGDPKKDEVNPGCWLPDFIPGALAAQMWEDVPPLSVSRDPGEPWAIMAVGKDCTA